MVYKNEITGGVYITLKNNVDKTIIKITRFVTLG
jgi:hypothetical protein